MRLRDDWKLIATKAWSIRFIAAAGVLTGAEAMLPLLSGNLPLTDVALSLLTFAVVAGAFWARLIAQQDVK